MNWTYGKRTKPALWLSAVFFYPKREDVVKALYPILMHPEMICCPKIQLLSPAATNCAQLLRASSLCCFPEGSHTGPGCAVHRQSLHNATCQTVSHMCIFKSKCIVLHWTYFWLGKAAGLKTQSPSKSFKIKSVLQNQSIHSNSCRPDLLSQVSTLLNGSNSDKSFASLVVFIIVKIPTCKNYRYFAKENKGKIYLPTPLLSHLL